MTARRPYLRAACAALLLLLSGACTSSSHPKAKVPTLAEVRSLLARHGAAVRAHDRAAFLADLDSSSAARGFRGRQAAEFANLIKLPLTTWTYSVEAPDRDPGARAAAARKYGVPALIVEVQLRYALRGVDATPTRHDLWWTFVRRDGRTTLAGDTDLAASGGTTWRGPWDFGPLDVVRGSACLVLGHPDDDAALHTIAAVVDAAVPAVTAVWGPHWTRFVGVLVPASTAELDADVGPTTSVTADIAAVAVNDGTDAVSGAVLGQRLVVEPSSLTKLSAVGRRIVYTHEITHIADATATSDLTPRWVAEGFADYVGNLTSGQRVTTIAAELRADVRRGKVPQDLPVDADFDTASSAAQAYEGSWLACRLIANRVGQAGLVRFYRDVGAANSDTNQAVAAALREVLHETRAQFVAQWRAYLVRELR